MNARKRLFAMMIVLVLGFATVGMMVAQTTDTTTTVPATTTDDLTDEIATVDSTALLDNDALLTKLSAQFGVELSVLQDLNTQGYSAGQIWLALEISKQSGATLADAVTTAASMGTEGHGWGVLAQALGIDPGSAEFFQLKEQMRNRTQTMASEIGAAHGNKVMAQERTETNTENHGAGSGKPESAGTGSGAGGRSGTGGSVGAGGGSGAGGSGEGGSIGVGAASGAGGGAGGSNSGSGKMGGKH